MGACLVHFLPPAFPLIALPSAPHSRRYVKGELLPGSGDRRSCSLPGTPETPVQPASPPLPAGCHTIHVLESEQFLPHHDYRHYERLFRGVDPSHHLAVVLFGSGIPAMGFSLGQGPPVCQ